MDTITYEQWLAIGRPTQTVLLQESKDDSLEFENVLHVFSKSHASMVESYDQEGNLIEAIYIEEHNNPDFVGSVIPDRLLTNPKANQGRKLAASGDYVSTLGNVRTFNADLESANLDGSSRYLEMWSKLADRPHPSQLMNLVYCADTIHAFATNPQLVVCPACHMQTNKHLMNCYNCGWYWPL